MHLRKILPHLRPPVQPFSASREDFQKGSRSLGFRILSVHQGAVIFLVRFACLSFAVTVGSTYRFFHNGHCNLAIDRPLPPEETQKRRTLVQHTLSSAKYSAQLLCYPAIFWIIDLSSFATSQRCRRTQVS